MSLANPAQLAKLIDEDYEIRSHGTCAKDPKLAGMSLIEQFDCLISLSHEQESSEGQHKVEEEESSEEQHKEEGGEGGEGEDEDEDEDEEEEFGVCEVCLKEDKHDTFDCPYLDRIPNLEATIGDGYAIVCRECHVLGGHPDWGWVGRAVMKNCNICQRPGTHWDSECPKNPDPKVYDVASGRKVLMWEAYGGI